MTPVQHLVQNDSDSEEVAAPIDLLTEDLLRRHIGDGPDNLSGNTKARGRHVSGTGPAAGRNPLGQTEVQNLYVAVSADHDVGGLEIAVNDARVVRRAQGFDHLTGYSETLLRGRMMLQPLAQRIALHQLRHHIARAG